MSANAFWATEEPEDAEGKWVHHCSGFGAGGEYTACGFSLDHWQVAKSWPGYIESDQTEPKRPEDKSLITCENCEHALNLMTKSFKIKNGRYYQNDG